MEMFNLTKKSIKKISFYVTLLTILWFLFITIIIFLKVITAYNIVNFIDKINGWAADKKYFCKTDFKNSWKYKIEKNNNTYSLSCDNWINIVTVNTFNKYNCNNIKKIKDKINNNICFKIINIKFSKNNKVKKINFKIIKK